MAKSSAYTCISTPAATPTRACSSAIPIPTFAKKTLLEVLQSPLFMAYHDGQPFNENHLRPCPMPENPELLREMIAKTGAHSTDLQSPESAEHLCAKCDLYAMNWKPEADRLWAESHPNGAKKSE